MDPLGSGIPDQRPARINLGILYRASVIDRFSIRLLSGDKFVFRRQAENY
jgi:hypothetical protein